METNYFNVMKHIMEESIAFSVKPEKPSGFSYYIWVTNAPALPYSIVPFASNDQDVLAKAKKLISDTVCKQCEVHKKDWENGTDTIIFEHKETASGYIKKFLAQMEEKFQAMSFRLSYDDATHYFIVEVEPVEWYDDKNYSEMEMKLWEGFRANYPDENILISCPDSRNNMSNVIYQTNRNEEKQ